MIKKGDRVLVPGTCGELIEAIFDHEHGGKFYVKMYPDNCLYEYDCYKPVKETLEEWTLGWLIDKGFAGRHKFFTPKGWIDTFNQYYDDRKKWEESQ